jgi:hypothetical protein
MPDELPSGDKAVYIFLEMIALGFALEAVASFMRNDVWWKWIGALVMGILFLLAGVKWPQIKLKVGTRFAHYLNLRPIWMTVFIILSLYVLQKSVVLDFVMNLHQRWHGWFGYAGFGLVGAVLLCGYWWLTGVMLKPGRQGETKPAGAPAGQDEKAPTLLDLFTKDFPNTMKAADDAIGIQWKDGEVLHIKRQLYLDFPAKTKFVGFYVPTPDPLSSTKSFEACLRLAEENAVQQTLDDIPKKVAVSGGFRGEMTSIQDLTFSGRVLIYHDAFLSITQKADIIHAYTARHFDVQFRGPDYLGDQVIAWHHQHDAKAAHQ